jgi:tagaturonate reductase
LVNGNKVEENIVNSSISRVINAQDGWEQILECAHNQAMQVVISNTTEVGIQLVNEDIRKHPPTSFPGKLLAFLFERYTAFGGSEHSGMVIIPTELIPNNGKKLEAIILELAHLNSLDDGFIEWLECCNYFCNSLVDRIVPGKPDVSMIDDLQSTLGYKDELLTVSEVYRLWAIEGDETVKNILSFAKADEGVVITPDIDLYRELKLRLLNGTHTLSCGAAFLAGFETVKEAMDSDSFSNFVSGLMKKEIAPSIPYTIDPLVSQEFSTKVLDRFCNPHLKHNWISITVQYTSKMKLRCIPLLQNHFENANTPLPLFAFGFAAYLQFMKVTEKRDNKYFGEREGNPYEIVDDSAEYFYKKEQEEDKEAITLSILKDVSFWGSDLTLLPHFADAVLENQKSIQQNGLKKTIETLQLKKEMV